jgi:hypothetical protein
MAAKKRLNRGFFLGRAIAVRRAALERISNLTWPVMTASAMSVKDLDTFPTKPEIHS